MLNLQNMRIAIAAIVIAIWIWVALAATGHAGYEIGPPCHPDKHVCKTDSECEDEEAYFLDLDELHQSDDELAALQALDNTINR